MYRGIDTFPINFWHRQAIALAIILHPLRQPITQLGSHAHQLLRLRRVIERDRTCFYRFVRFFVTNCASFSAKMRSLTGRELLSCRGGMRWA